MRFALASRQRVEAYPGGKGMCPVCNGEVIAKCGTHRVSHWAHRGIRDCDSWAEKETDWHRAWKNNFPAECQEFIQHDGQSGEKHIADVRTPHGLVIEFQHSHLRPLERAGRERFYGNMVWDGGFLRKSWCGLLMPPAYNETIRALIGERIISGARITRDTSSSHSLMSAFPRCGLIVQSPSFLISGVWMRVDHRMRLG